jgi:hypothetical protein
LVIHSLNVVNILTPLGDQKPLARHEGGVLPGITIGIVIKTRNKIGDTRKAGVGNCISPENRENRQHQHFLIHFFLQPVILQMRRRGTDQHRVGNIMPNHAASACINEKALELLPSRDQRRST